MYVFLWASSTNKKNYINIQPLKSSGEWYLQVDLVFLPGLAVYFILLDSH